MSDPTVDACLWQHALNSRSCWFSLFGKEIQWAQWTTESRTITTNFGGWNKQHETCPILYLLTFSPAHWWSFCALWILVPWSPCPSYWSVWKIPVTHFASFLFWSLSLLVLIFRSLFRAKTWFKKCWLLLFAFYSWTCFSKLIGLNCTSKIIVL